MEDLEESHRLEKSVLKVFDKYHNSTNESSEAKALELLSQLPNPAEVKDDTNKWTLLHHACYNGWGEVAKVLIEKYNCDTNCRNAVDSIPLHLACWSGDLDLVKYLILVNDCDPNDKNGKGRCPLHYAASDGHLQLIQFCTELRDEVLTISDSCGWTPLHYACKKGHINIVKYLVEELQCNPACSDKDGMTPLYLACEMGHRDEVKYLIEEQQCNPAYKKFDDLTPLHSACLMGHLCVAQYLIEEQQCDPACRMNDGQTSLHLACDEGHLAVAKYLIEKQHINESIIDALGRTPLHLASLKGHLHIAKYLVEERHIKQSRNDTLGQTPLHLACQMGHLHLAKYLIKEQCISQPICDTLGQTPLHLACRRGHLHLTKYLIEKQLYNPASRMYNGQAPLHFACDGGHITVVKYLIEEQHIDPSVVRDGDGRTPLHLTCLNGHLDIAKCLIEEWKCNQACSDNNGVTPLHFASGGGHLDVVKYLVEKQQVYKKNHKVGIFQLASYFKQKDDPICRKDCSLTPLHFACDGGHLIVAKYYIEEQQIDPSIRNIDGWTPLHSACLKGHLHIARYLIEEQQSYPDYITYDNYYTPLHMACQGGNLELVKYLVEKLRCDPNAEGKYDWTPLYSACKGGHLNVARYLIEVCNCDPTCRLKVYGGSSPLSLACNSHRLDLVMYLVNHCNCNLTNSGIIISREFVENDTDIAVFLISSCDAIGPNVEHKDLLLYPAFKVFVMGNFASGKSTLVKAMQEHFQVQPNFAITKKWRYYQMVSGVELHTAGIVSVDILIPNCGRAIMYDFAGQAEYYSSHAALCENLMTAEGCLIIVVFNLSKHLNVCVQELRFWKLFINNQLRSCSHYPPIVFIASYADKVTDPAHEARQVIVNTFGEECHQNIVHLDCRQRYSTGLQTISDSIIKYCTRYQESNIVETKTHLLLYFIRLYFKEGIACLLGEIFQVIISLRRKEFLKRNGQLPETVNEVSDLLTILNESGELLYLKNDKDLKKSWIILKKDALFNEINGNIFAPKDFKNYQKISNSTGVVPLSNIRQRFPHYDPQMLIGFMVHLELCHEISKHDAKIINIDSSCSTSISIQGSESFYFFPALVKGESPNRAFFKQRYKYKHGWCLQRVNTHQYLTSRFLHTLLLRLAFTFALQCEQEVHSIVLQRECNIWKSGIHWMNKDGVEVVVEVVEQSTAVVVVFGCTEINVMKCLQLRSAVIHMILSTVKQFCGAVELKEYLIDPDELKSYPLRNVNDLFKYSIKRLALSIMEKKEITTVKIGECFKSTEVDKLLYFEPYTCLSDKLIAHLHSGDDNLNQPISNSFLLDIASSASLKQSKLKEILPINKSELDGAIAQCNEQYKADQRHQCFLLLRTWRDGNENTTLNGLRELLDSYSIFCGRNPLDFVSDAPHSV